MARTKIGVINYEKNRTPRIVYVEPWADDYTLLPGEELVIEADSGTSEFPWFNVVESEGATQVYCEATREFSVWQNGRKLKCGHNRDLQ